MKALDWMVRAAGSGHCASLAAAVSVILGAGGTAQGAAGTIAAAGGQAIEINFEARVGDKPFKCGERYEDVGISKATILPQDFRLYVSDVRLLTAEGKETSLLLTPDNNWQSDNVVLLDFEDDTGNCSGNPRTNRVVRGTAPKDDDRGLVFTIGVPVELNHLDPTLAAAPLNVSDLFWPWRVGYKFTSIVFDSSRPPVGAPSMPGRETSTYSLVLGSMEGGDGPWDAPPTVTCKSPNRPLIRLEAFDVTRQNVTLDLAALFASSDLSIRPPNSNTGCWSFPENDDCMAVMSLLGLPFRSMPPAHQTFARSASLEPHVLLEQPESPRRRHARREAARPDPNRLRRLHKTQGGADAGWGESVRERLGLAGPRGRPAQARADAERGGAAGQSREEGLAGARRFGNTRTTSTIRTGVPTT